MVLDCLCPPITNIIIIQPQKAIKPLNTKFGRISTKAIRPNIALSVEKYLFFVFTVKNTEINIQEESKKNPLTTNKILRLGYKMLGIVIKAKGNIKAAAESFIAETASKSGFVSVIALAAYAATATGGVIADKTAK